MTACAAACSYSVTQFRPALSAKACGTFLRTVLMSLCPQVGCPFSVCRRMVGATSRAPSPRPAARRGFGIPGPDPDTDTPGRMRWQKE